MSRKRKQKRQQPPMHVGPQLSRADKLVKEGMWLQMAGKHGPAMEHYIRALELTPGHAGALFAAGLLSQHLGRKEEAAKCFKASLQSEPKNADAWYNLGKMHHDLGRPDEALPCYLAALEHDEYHAHALGNAGHCFMAKGDVKAARLCWDRLLARDPKSPEAIYNRSFVKLLHGDLEGGWADYEARWNCPGYKLEYGRNDLHSVPLWTDQDLAYRVLYLHGEQGLGDQIQMLRFVSEIERRSPEHVIIEVLPALVPLVANTWPGYDVRERSGRADVTGVDFHLPMMSLPARHGGRHPDRVPYLTAKPGAAPAEVREWIEREHIRGQRVLGLVWAGSSTHPGDWARSIPADELAPLAEVPGVSWLSLQIGERANDAPWFEVRRVHEHVTDFRTSAAIASLLDGVVTVDTSTAHLAGALALPTWTLLPPVPDYRWQLERLDTDLYPTMRLWRRGATESWRTVLERVADELRAGGLARRTRSL